MSQEYRVVPAALLESALKTLAGVAPGRFAVETELRAIVDAPVTPAGGEVELPRPVMKLEAEKLWGRDGEYTVSFERPGWLQQCREKGGTFPLYPLDEIQQIFTSLQAENAGLQHFKTSYMEWHDKTESLLQGFEAGELGRHRADVLRSRFHRIQAESSALQQRLTIADQQVDDLQSELAKARELIAKPAVKDCSWPSAVCECMHCESRLKP